MKLVNKQENKYYAWKMLHDSEQGGYIFKRLEKRRVGGWAVCYRCVSKQDAQDIWHNIEQKYFRGVSKKRRLKLKH